MQARFSCSWGASCVFSQPPVMGTEIAQAPSAAAAVPRSEARLAVRAAWRALWTSRLLVLASGAGAVAATGEGLARTSFDPGGLTGGFGTLGDALAAPFARWDSVWYLLIARWGYRPELGSLTRAREAFFPLYPLSVGLVASAGLPAVLVGVAVSLAALFAALVGLHRLARLELGRLDSGGARSRRAADLAVLLVAFAPVAFFLSAVYAEALYLALTVWLFWFARQGRWALVGLLGMLAAATRPTGLMLAPAALVLYLYGPRADRPGRDRRRWAPRYRLRPDVLWLVLIPIGTVAFCVAIAAAGGELLGPLHAQAYWEREFAGPFSAVWQGAVAAFDGARQLLSGQRSDVYFTAAGGSPMIAAGHNLMLFAFLALGLVCAAGAIRLLPAAYAVYLVCALALPLSYPVAPQPLMSIPRFLLVLFPLFIWAAWRLAPYRRTAYAVVGASGILLAAFTGEFATWHWVA